MDLLFHRPFIVPILLLTFLAFLPVPSFGCGFTVSFDNWNITHNDSTLLQIQPRYHITLNSTFEFIVPTTLHVQFSNVSILDTWNLDSGFSSHTFGYLSKPLEIYIDSNGSILNIEFIDKLDIEESRVVKRSILNDVWSEIDYFEQVAQCFCSPTPNEHQRFRRLADSDDEPGPSCKVPKIVADSVATRNVVYLNWTERGYVGRVKDQGPCEACWAFGITGLLENYNKQRCECNIKKAAEDNKSGDEKSEDEKSEDEKSEDEKLEDKKKDPCPVEELSEQHLMDRARNLPNCGGCVGEFGKSGCTMELGFTVVRRSGVCLESVYKWIHADNISPLHPKTGCFGYSREDNVKREAFEPENDGSDHDEIVKRIKEHLEDGPVAVVVNIHPDKSIWHDYFMTKGGKPTGFDVQQVIKEGNKPGAIGHAILLVGRGVYHDEEFWLFKNSWTAKFGDYGYGKLSVKVGQNNALHEITYVEKPKPKTCT